VNEFQDLSSINLFPNPVENILQIQVDQNIDLPLLIEMYDVTGRKFFSGKIYQRQYFLVTSDALRKRFSP